METEKAREDAVVGLDHAFIRAAGRARRKRLDNIFSVSSVGGCTGERTAGWKERAVSLCDGEAVGGARNVWAGNFVTHHAIRVTSSRYDLELRQSNLGVARWYYKDVECNK